MREVIERIKAAHSAAVLPHVNEDADALGSCFAFAEVLRGMGIEAVVYVSEIPEKRLDFIGGDYVVYEKGKKYKHDLCVCLDCGDIKRLGDRKKLLDETGNSVNIDHHFTNTGFADANYMDGNAAATGEILCMLFREMGISLNSKIARYLYIAICSDTGGFKYSNVSPRTMRLAADLIEYDFDHAEAARRLFDCESYAGAMMCAEVTLGIKSYADGKIKVVTVPDELYKKYNLEVKDAPNMVDIPRRIEGTEIAVCIKPNNGEVRVNLRSNGYADVSKTALKFGGGGHARAAGCNVKTDSLEEAEKLIVESLKEVI